MAKRDGKKKKNRDKSGNEFLTETLLNERSSGDYAKELARLQEEIAHLQA